MSALDQGLRRETRAELVRLRRSLGISFVLVTHDQNEALEMADRIASNHRARDSGGDVLGYAPNSPRRIGT